MESESKPQFIWPLAPTKPRARTPITAKPPLAPLPRVPRASVPPPMVAEPVRVEPPKPVVRVEPVYVAPPPPVVVAPAKPAEVAPAWIEPVRVEPPPIVVEAEPEPALEDSFFVPESGPMTLEDDMPVDHGGLDTMSTFGAGVLNQKRGANKFFIFVALLAVAAIVALIVR